MKMILSAEEGKKIATALRQYAKDNGWTDSDYEDFLAEDYGKVIDIVFRALGVELCVDGTSSYEEDDFNNFDDDDDDDDEDEDEELPSDKEVMNLIMQVLYGQ